MKSEKLKRFRVTQTLRFPSNIMKGFFYAGLVLLPLGLVVAVLSFFVPALEGVRGIAVIAAALSVIWLFAAKFISETNFGLANVSFTEQGIIFRTGGAGQRRVSPELGRCGLLRQDQNALVVVVLCLRPRAEREGEKGVPRVCRKGRFLFLRRR